MGCEIFESFAVPFSGQKHGFLPMIVLTKMALRPGQPSSQRVQNLSWNVKLTAHLNLVPKCRMHGTLPPRPYMSYMLQSVGTREKYEVYQA
jgi:hypothetical protein